MSHDLSSISAAIYREARLLDQKSWKEWLLMYEEDAVYWAPGWLNEYDLVDDPDRQVSLIYHTNRGQLAERISRIQSRKSITALPLPRTVHVISNVHFLDEKQSPALVSASFVVHVFDPRTAREHCHFGHYEFLFSLSGESPTIASKKIILANDRIPTVVDFYSL
ncbi:hypothetical protein RPMA_26280 [Tardiphaga alba]|uniref:Benzoate/toluate 1,2-dioxygenase beta subunit n=1 Tax=Tardiphaga alba TaxID=340268 RepID=A0ABX8ADZ4_9BRAD|nr:aromatic-ring-hydroxylating dioxygenase subunit beta [Tardiphaga alba]QUS41952.1 hypothetical protein RPMA_26280 [Tardiphaga alba]